MKRKLKNRMLVIILIVVISVGMFPPITVQASEETDTDSTNTIYISSAEGLAAMSSSTYSSFILTEDIEITGNWNPISNFTGTFDGSGYSITYNINENTGPFPSTQYLGLFASCNNATIKNLYVNGNISLTTGSSMSNPNVYAGGIAASSTNTTFENVHFSGNINVVTNNDNSSWVGGIVGHSTNTQILLSSSTASVTGDVKSAIGITKVGGLCGEFAGSIENCYNTGNVLASAVTGSPYGGGLVGNNKGNITKSYNSGKVQSQGSGMSLSDVYAGGIAGVCDTNSTVTNCAVMAPEISVAIGWINSGYKYIIAKGGSKSNNISINSITGSPTNDSNARYSQAELKTASPYSNFDFYNTWSIDGTINNGYPFHEKNIYAISKNEIVIPIELNYFITNEYININDLKQTSDGFTLCTKPLNEILSDMSINEIRGSGVNDVLELGKLDDWYIYNIGTDYSILKMRNRTVNPETNEVESGIGTAIPFLDLDLDLIKSLHEDIDQEVENSVYEVQLYNELNRVTQGIVDSNYSFNSNIANYFANKYSKANYLIAEEYIRKIIRLDKDSDGYIIVPDNLNAEQSSHLSDFSDIYDAENNRIQVNSYNLTNYEKRAIMACSTGNKSINNYASENIGHAQLTKVTGNFLQGEGDELNIINYGIVSRYGAEELFERAIKSDAGVGEESTPKDSAYFNIIASSLTEIYGDI